MDCYFCIVNLPGKMSADLCVLAAIDDAGAMRAMTVQAAQWVGYETIFLYYGERFVGSLIDGNKGFPVSGCKDASVSIASCRTLSVGSRHSGSPSRPASTPYAARKAG